ncbi:MAG: tRNA dimethylallyltransferase [Nitrosomonas sp.]|jgi:type IV pilus biogenesis protein CpaD/CtpE|uniref:tRNA dimethylallyltransferase n=1 Tax=Nitrosomonas sp. TaxID=42353 RepID=UPI00272F9099|nr:tRNA dimethylallyltransferase [Nitrosomonas sp.]MDP1549295.1 tRNA dimethylallyltransferase [Nitrosomonas sp.]
MSKFSIKTTLCLPITILVMTACVTSPPKRLDAKFGNALDMAKAQQTMNPDASLNPAPVKGIDGQAGDAIFDNYRESYINRPMPARGALDVGTSGGSAR